MNSLLKEYFGARRYGYY